MMHAVLFLVRRSAFRGAAGFAPSKGGRVALVFGFLLVLLITSSPLLARIWTDSSGTHRTEADLVKVLNESVRLRTADGRDIEVPITKLSAQDQKFVIGERLKQDRAEAQPANIKPGEGKEGRPFDSLLPLLGAVAMIVLGVFLYIQSRFEKIKSEREKIESEREKIQSEQALVAEIEFIRCELRRIIEEKFLVQPCSRCHEFSMQFLDVSPNARSVEYHCLHCGKKSRAAAISPNSAEFFECSNRLSSAVCLYNSISESPIAESPIEFRTAPAPMPYEQTQRSPISEAVRSEVWRRDQGRCGKCNSNENLQYDHIIPVARGGATSVQNLQLLCQRCNQAKGARI